MEECSLNLYTWSVFSEEKQLDFNGYYVGLPDGALLIDPPPLDDREIADLDGLGTPTRILLTNKDHRRAAPELAQRFGADIWIHEADADGVDCAVSATFTDGDSLAGELRVVHLADQKSPGECALYWASRRTLFLGDALLGVPPGTLTMLPAAKYADPARARAGLARLADLDVACVLVGDGASVLSDGGAAIRAFLGRE